MQSNDCSCFPPAPVGEAVRGRCNADARKVLVLKANVVHHVHRVQLDDLRYGAAVHVRLVPVLRDNCVVPVVCIVPVLRTMLVLRVALVLPVIVQQCVGYCFMVSGNVCDVSRKRQCL